MVDNTTFTHNIEDLANKWNIRKENVKRMITRYGMQENADYMIVKPNIEKKKQQKYF